MHGWNCLAGISLYVKSASKEMCILGLRNFLFDITRVADK